eukprot:g1894.t1
MGQVKQNQSLKQLPCFYKVISYGLTQSDVEEVAAYCGGVFSHDEISVLYRRFRNLDRGRKGYITSEEFMHIPELTINPLAQRIVRMFEGVNFLEFCRLLVPFSIRATHEMKVQAIFDVFDVDGDGAVSRDDLSIVLRQLCGTCLSDDEMDQLLNKVFIQAGVKDGLTPEIFYTVFKDSELNMDVEIPLYLPGM